MTTGPLTHAELATVIKNCTGVAVDPETLAGSPELTFAELGIESLGVLGIVAALENRYGIQLRDDAEQCQYPEQLRELVTSATGEEASSDASAH